MRVRRSLIVSIACAAVVFATAGAGNATTKTPTPVNTLRSFAFTVKVDATGAPSALGSRLTLTSTGVFMKPANQDCAVTVALGKITLKQQLVVVGKKTWVDSGSGLEVAKPGDFDFADFCPSNPGFWTGFAIKTPKSITAAPETRNGIASLHYDAGTNVAALSGFRALGDLPADVGVTDLQLFAARGGWLVAVQLGLHSESATSCASLTSASPVPLQAPCSVSVSYDLSSPNDKTLTVTSPKTSAKK